MRKDLTIIYYTANKEKESFESKIRQKLLDVIGGLPLISVSQKKIENFGENICVGKQPYCDVSALRQLLIGLKRAKTKFAIAAESDCLYPPDYFTFVPPQTNCVYRYDNVWITTEWVGPHRKGLYWKKLLCEGAQMCGRKHWIEAIEKSIGEQTEEWVDGKCSLVFKDKLDNSWGSKSPVISFKTENGLRKGCRTSNMKVEILSYWGSSAKIRNEFFNN